jgi:NAD dependent epimerase/dehydratase family enzyme
MRIVDVGATALIGCELAGELNHNGHHVVTTTQSKGINTITGEDLDKVLSVAEIVVDVANSPCFEDSAPLKFFEMSGSNLRGAPGNQL